MFHIMLAVSLQSALQIPMEKIRLAPAANTVVGRVNGKPVTAAVVQKVLWDWTAKDVTQEILTAFCIDQAAEKAGITLSAQDVQKYVNDTLAKNRQTLPPDASESRILLRARMQLILETIAIKDFKPENARKIRRIVFVPSAPDEKSKAEAKKLADEAAAALKAGEPWAAVVQKYSKDNQTKAADGLVGWIFPSDLPENMKLVLDAAKPNDITPVLDSGQNGALYIYKIEAMGPPSGEELEKLRQSYLSRSIGPIYQSIVNNSKIENLLLPAKRAGG